MIDDLSGFYRSLILLHLLRKDVVQRLGSRRTAKELAESHGWHQEPLQSCLDFIAETTTLIRRDRKQRYYTTLTEDQAASLSFMVEKFVGAYGRCATRLPEILRGGGSQGRALLNETSLSRAFNSLVEMPRSLVVAMIVGAQKPTLLDLGCGTGSLLVQLAEVQPQFTGIGVDSSRAMCAAARRHVTKHRLQSRVRILHQDAQDISNLPEADALHAASLLNEMFAQGAAEAIEFLRKLRNRFEGRDLWLVDYNGRLGSGIRRGKPGGCHALLQDLIQVLSGQGIPPSNLKEWRKIYHAAGCRLVEAHEFSDAGLMWFVHRVRLS